jgi:hypothetical protein
MYFFYSTVYGKKTVVLCTYALLVVNSRNTNTDYLQILLVTTKQSNWLHWLEVVDSWFWLCHKQSKNAYLTIQLVSCINVSWKYNMKKITELPSSQKTIIYNIIKWDNDPVIILCMDVTRKTSQSSVYFKIRLVGNILCSILMVVVWFFVHSIWRASKLDCFIHLFGQTELQLVSMMLPMNGFW